MKQGESNLVYILNSRKPCFLQTVKIRQPPRGKRFACLLEIDWVTRKLSSPPDQPIFQEVDLNLSTMSLTFSVRSEHPTARRSPKLPREGPSASVHPKRFSTCSFTHKVLCAGNLNPRFLDFEAKPRNKCVMRLSHERSSRRLALVPTAQCGIVQTAEINFTCPHCASLYEVVRAEALPESVDSRIACLTCAGPLPTREAQFILKYFLLRKADRGWQRIPLGAQSE